MAAQAGEPVKVSSATGSANADTDLTLTDPGDGGRIRVFTVNVACAGATVVGDVQVQWLYDGSTADVILGNLTTGGRGNVFEKVYDKPLTAKHSTAPIIRAKAAGASTVLTVTATYDNGG